MNFVGDVFVKRYAPGSKSERDAVMIRLEEGEFLIRRRDGNPFYDEALHGLIGKTIRCEGELITTTLILDHWEICPEGLSAFPSTEKEK